METMFGESIVDRADSAAEHIRTVMSSSKDMTWATPQKWFDYLDLEFDFTLDPCCWPGTAKCKKYYTPVENGLAQSWADERVFMNPPYGTDLILWMRKAYEECRDRGALVVCFVPARVDTEWWHSYASKGEIRFPKGRVWFEGAKAAAPFPVAIVIFRPRIPLPGVPPELPLLDTTTVPETRQTQETVAQSPLETRG